MTLRPMEMSDADFMLELKNYPETREFAIETTAEIKREDHIKWLKPKLMFFQVIEGWAGPIGAIRIFGNEISIWVDRRFWGMGVATNILRDASSGTTARIVDGNVASMKAFVKAGFVPVGHTDHYYILRK